MLGVQDSWTPKNTENQIFQIISNNFVIQTLQLTNDFNVRDLICSSHQPNETDVVYSHFTDQETEAQGH